MKLKMYNNIKWKEFDEVGGDMAFDTPFAYNGKWFIKETKDGEHFKIKAINFEPMPVDENEVFRKE